MTKARSASLRVLTPIAVIALAAVLLAVLAISLGDSESDEGKRGKGGGAKTERTDEKFYTVEPGDSLTSISDKTGVGVDKLSRLNPDLDPQALISGQRVKLR
jgi:LysM repeat protein